MHGELKETDMSDSRDDLPAGARVSPLAYAWLTHRSCPGAPPHTRS
jgi:hypothetical protein